MDAFDPRSTRPGSSVPSLARRIAAALSGAALLAVFAAQPTLAVPKGPPDEPPPKPKPAPRPTPPPTPVPPPAPACSRYVPQARRIIGQGYATPADYDGDGRYDPSEVLDSGTWAIDFSGNGFGAYDVILPWGRPNALSLPVPADYDGDCRADRAAKDAAGNWLIDYASNGFGGWDAVYGGFGDSRYQPVPADYDGDGRVDLSTKDHVGNWYIDYASNGFGVWDAIYPGFGGPEFAPIPADYDGDGRADFSTKDTGGNWYIDSTLDGRGEADWDFIYPGFGGPEFMPVPADYDGDHLVDLSTRDTWDHWYIDWAANGRAEPAWDLILGGFAGTDFAPCPADYDGDGRADLCSHRFNGLWLIDFARNGFGVWDQIWTTAPAAPTSPSVANSGPFSLSIRWNDNSANESAFIVRYGESGGSLGSSQTLGANSTSAALTGLDEDKSYCFTVQALSSFGNSDPSYQVCGRTVLRPRPVISVSSTGSGTSTVFTISGTGFIPNAIAVLRITDPALNQVQYPETAGADGKFASRHSLPCGSGIRLTFTAFEDSDPSLAANAVVTTCP